MLSSRKRKTPICLKVKAERAGQGKEVLTHLQNAYKTSITKGRIHRSVQCVIAGNGCWFSVEGDKREREREQMMKQYQEV